MPSPRQQPLPDSQLMLRGICVMGLLWALVIWNSVALSSQDLVPYPQHNIAATADNFEFASSEHKVSPRSGKTFFSSSPQPDEKALLPGALFIVALVILLARVKLSKGSENGLHCAHRLQLQTLNISRAPPSLH